REAIHPAAKREERRRGFEQRLHASSHSLQFLVVDGGREVVAVGKVAIEGADAYACLARDRLRSAVTTGCVDALGGRDDPLAVAHRIRPLGGRWIGQMEVPPFHASRDSSTLFRSG